MADRASRGKVTATGRGTDVEKDTTVASDRDVDRRTDDRTSPVATSTQPARQPVPEPARPEPSPRTDVAVSMTTALTAFATGGASQTVGYVQHVLRSRGFDPGSMSGVADAATRRAYAQFQASIGEQPTGVPTDHSLDYLGFDVFG